MFEIGAKVVCINDSFAQGIIDIYDDLPNKGQIYVVRDVVPAEIPFTKQPTCAILLKEIKNPPCERLNVEYGFNPNRFRELSKDGQKSQKKNRKKKKQKATV